jgi:integrase
MATKLPLTKARIDRAKPGDTAYVLWDDELAGFGCRVHPTGRRSFVVSYRLPGDRRMIWVTLGIYGVLTVAEARVKAREVLKDARLGIDPQDSRKARRVEAEAFTVGELVERYLKELRAGAVITSRSKGRPATAAYIADTALHLGRFAAALGRRVAMTLDRSDVAGALAPYAGQPSVHRRMHGAIHRLYDWAQHRGLVRNAPADRIVTTAAPARERVLSLQELATIWRAAEGLDPLYRDYVHLLIATGQRRAEVAGMTWSEIDLARGLWTLPGARTKARRQHTIPLPALAVRVLQVRQRTAGEDLVLPSRSRDGKVDAPISGWAWLKRELDQRTSELPAWQMHDFRRSLVTHCAEQGADIAVLDSLLNHAAAMTRGGIVGVYQKATLIEPMRKLMAVWDKLINQAIKLIGCQAVRQRRKG